MAVATLIDEQIDENVTKSFVQYTLTQTFQVILDPGQNVMDVFTAAGLPPPNTIYTIAGFPRLQLTRRNPRRDNVEDSRRKWLVDCVFTNDTEQYEPNAAGGASLNLETTVKDVQHSFEIEQEIITDAAFKSVGEVSVSGRYADDKTEALVGVWLDGYAGPVCNSALAARQVYRQKSQKVITVTRYERNWDPQLDNFIDKINSEQVVIEERDEDGLRSRTVCEPETLLMHNIRKQNIRRQFKLYFLVSYVMKYREETWRHWEVDSGYQRLAVPGETFNVPKDALYTQDDVNKIGQAADGVNLESTYHSITTDESGTTVAPNEPYKFDGFGVEYKNQRSGRVIEVGFDLYNNRKIDFNVLNL